MFVEPDRDALSVLDQAQADGALRCDRHLHQAGRRTGCGICERRHANGCFLPCAFRSDRGLSGLGGRQPEANHQRQSLRWNSGHLNDPSKFSTLSSALAVPLEGVTGVIGVLALYRSQRDAFTSDHLRILLAVSGKMALSIENALKYQQAESSATTDYLTGLPNARSLFLQLDRDLARCKRDNSTLTVMKSRYGRLQTDQRSLRTFGRQSSTAALCSRRSRTAAVSTTMSREWAETNSW